MISWWWKGTLGCPKIKHILSLSNIYAIERFLILLFAGDFSRFWPSTWTELEFWPLKLNLEKFAGKQFSDNLLFLLLGGLELLWSGGRVCPAWKIHLSILYLSVLNTFVVWWSTGVSWFWVLFFLLSAFANRTLNSSKLSWPSPSESSCN